MQLFWSKRGIVACDTHAPRLDSDEWQIQGWQQVPASQQHTNTAVLQCQFCHGRPYAHQTRVRERKVATDNGGTTVSPAG
jgi:hypothetical protein